MKTVNVHEAKTHLSRLIQEAVAGEPFVIAKAGRPLVRVVAFESAEPLARTGFLAGAIRTPDDFDRLDAEALARDFDGDP